MRNKAQYQPLIVFPIFSLLSDASEDAIDAGKRYLNKLPKLNGDKIQILQLSPDVDGAPEDKMKGKQGAKNLRLFTLQLWNFLSCTL